MPTLPGTVGHRCFRAGTLNTPHLKGRKAGRAPRCEKGGRRGDLQFVARNPSLSNPPHSPFFKGGGGVSPGGRVLCAYAEATVPDSVRQRGHKNCAHPARPQDCRVPPFEKGGRRGDLQFVARNPSLSNPPHSPFFKGGGGVLQGGRVLCAHAGANVPDSPAAWAQKLCPPYKTYAFSPAAEHVVYPGRPGADGTPRIGRIFGKRV